jgi:hypothetical protein
VFELWILRERERVVMKLAFLLTGKRRERVDLVSRWGLFNEVYGHVSLYIRWMGCPTWLLHVVLFTVRKKKAVEKCECMITTQVGFFFLILYLFLCFNSIF